VFGAALAEAATSDTSIRTHEEDIASASDQMRVVALAFIAGRRRHFDDLDRHACAPDTTSASRGLKLAPSEPDDHRRRRQKLHSFPEGSKPGRSNVD